MVTPGGGGDGSAIGPGFPPVSELSGMWSPLRTGWRQRNSDRKSWKDSFPCDPVEGASSSAPVVSPCVEGASGSFFLKKSMLFEFLLQTAVYD